MAITVPFLLIVIILLQHFYLRTSRQLRLLDLESRSPLYSHFMETISGLATIQAFQWQELFSRKNLKLLDASQRPYYLLYCIQRWLTLVLDLIVAAEAVILVGLVIKFKGSVSVGLIGVSLNNILCESSFSLLLAFADKKNSIQQQPFKRNFRMDAARGLAWINIKSTGFCGQCPAGRCCGDKDPASCAVA